MGIGDNLMCFRALSYFTIDESKIAWVHKSDSAELLEAVFPEALIFEINKKKTDSLARHILYLLKMFIGLILFLRRARNENVVILDYNWKPVLLFGAASRLAGIRNIIACTETRHMRWLLHRIIPMKRYASKHEVERYKDMFMQAGLEQINGGGKMNGLLLQRLDPGNIENHPQPRLRTVMLAVGSYRHFKRWNTENYEVIARRFVANDIRVCFVGDDSDFLLVDEMMKRLDERLVTNLCGKVSFVELAHRMKHAELLLTNDSAVMHLADLVGLQVIALFGVTRPDRCGPYAQLENVINAKGEGAGAYSFGEFAHYDDSCINQIDVDEVWEKIKNKMQL
jgi:ADP-heptose:LPS heptosyltransferase